jgi:cell division protein FtsL
LKKQSVVSFSIVPIAVITVFAEHATRSCVSERKLLIDQGENTQTDRAKGNHAAGKISIVNQ